MWLLNAYTSTLHEFSEGEVGHYLTLSHRWGPEELTFQDLTDSTDNKYRDKQGYRKAIGACQIARSFGYQWLWIDTCCINKRNSVELNEAINSMYRWYQKSAFCIAYLADYTHGRIPISRSSWFKRCWTLQELIAPPNVLFYDFQWIFAGSRLDKQLCAVISRITRISEHVLLGGDPREYSIAQRLSWAADRKATRIEDETYSLLGILGISMTAKYGIGSAVFHSLQKKLFQDMQQQDLSLLAWARLPKEQIGSLSGLFAPSPAHFFSSHNVQTLESNSGEIVCFRDYVEFNAVSVPHAQGIYLCVLPCTSTDSSYRCGIFLQRLESGERFARLLLGDTGIVNVHIDFLDSLLLNVRCIRQFYIDHSPAHPSYDLPQRVDIEQVSLPGSRVSGALQTLASEITSGFSGMHRGESDSDPVIPETQDTTVPSEPPDLFDDGATQYTFTNSEGSLHRDDLIASFAHHLLNDLNNSMDHEVAVGASPEEIIDLLADFSLRLICVASTQESRSAATFIHKHRKRIAQRLTQVHESESRESESDDNVPVVRDHQPGQVRVKEWLAEISAAPELPQSPTLEPVINDSITENQPEDVYAGYKHLIFSSVSYHWFKQDIRLEVLSVYPKPAKMGKTVSHHVRGLFRVKWQLRQFLKDNVPDLSTTHSVGSVLVLTGTQSNIQASTCLEYLQQTWPDTGKYMAGLIDVCVANDSQEFVSIKRSDEVKLQGRLSFSQLEVGVNGTRGVVAEIAEQIAWMASALRPALSPTGQRCYFARINPSIKCVPYQLSINTRRGLSWLTDPARRVHSMQSLTPPSVVERTFVISFTESDEPLPAKSDRHGLCWQQLFGSFVTVDGYPIPRRPHPGLGLEIRLDIAAELLGTRFINVFEGISHIKGYDAMMTPVDVVNDTAVWHLECAEPDEHMAYSSSKAKGILLSNSELTELRHIVGWCFESELRVGAPDADYNIKPSQLPSVDSTSDFRSNALAVPLRIRGSKDYIITNQQKKIRLGSEEYPSIFARLHDLSICLWDERTKQGWLSNGISVLLHLLRASLKYTQRSLPELFELDWDGLKESSQRYHVQSAQGFFKHESNLAAQIMVAKYKPGQTPDQETVEDRMIRIYHLLSQASELQGRQEREGRKTSRSRIVGWDFNDVSRQTQAMVPSRVASLAPAAYGWADTVRAMGTIFLFGRGFGDLIQPKPETLVTCPRWLKMPQSAYYLAICIPDLLSMIERCGVDIDEEPKRLTASLLWHNPYLELTDCSCSSDDKSCSRIVQVAWPKNVPLPFYRSIESRFLMEGCHGAVVFGHNHEFGWRWPSLGSPTSTLLSPQEMTKIVEDEDSGIGSSIAETPDGQSSSSKLSTRLSRADLDLNAPPRSDGHLITETHMSGGSALFGNDCRQVRKSYKIRNLYIGRDPPKSTLRPAKSVGCESSQLSLEGVLPGSTNRNKDPHEEDVLVSSASGASGHKQLKRRRASETTDTTDEE